MHTLTLLTVLAGLIITSIGVSRAQSAPDAGFTPIPIPRGSAYTPPPAPPSLPARSGGIWPNCHPGCVNTTNAPPPLDMPKELVDTWELGDSNEPIIGDPQRGWWMHGCSGGQYNDLIHQLESRCGRPWGSGWAPPPNWTPRPPSVTGTVPLPPNSVAPPPPQP